MIEFSCIVLGILVVSPFSHAHGVLCDISLFPKKFTVRSTKGAVLHQHGKKAKLRKKNNFFFGKKKQHLTQKTAFSAP